MRTYIGFIFFLTITGFVRAGSQPPPEPSIALVRSNDIYRIEADGRYALDAERIWLIKKEQAIKAFGQHQIPFSESMQSLDIVEAYTETPDGKKIEVAKDKILTKESASSMQAPMFSDHRVKAIIFPQVEVGSKLYYRYVRTQKKPLFPYQFSVVENFTLNEQIDDARLTVIAPKTMNLRTQAIDLSGGETECPPNEHGKQCFVWTMRNPVRQLPEPNSVNSMDYSPRVALSTFASYNAVADAYAKRAEDKSKVTQKIQALADSVTQGIDDKGKQAEALYYWVAKNIRYVAIYVGAGGVVPHPAETVLENRYGDCKDHVALLEALLAAKGMASTGVLVSVGNIYWMPDVPVASMFNHIVTYIPSLHRYADSTLHLAMFGAFGTNELGKPALLIKPVDGMAQLTSLPLSGLAPTRANTVVTMKMDGEGSITGTARVSDSGIAELMDRSIVQGLPEGQDEATTGKLLATIGQPGNGSFDRGDPLDTNKPYEYGTAFRLPNYVHLPGPGAFVMPTGLHGFFGIDGLIGFTTLQEHKYALAGCEDYAKHEEYTLELPAGMKLSSVPKNMDAKRKIGSYKSTYELRGNALHVVRDLSMTSGAATCSPEQYKDLRELASEVGKDLRAQVLYP